MDHLLCCGMQQDWLAAFLEALSVLCSSNCHVVASGFSKLVLLPEMRREPTGGLLQR